MRVIAGKAKGLPLKAPKGKSVRPTSDKVRGALFSILASAGVDMSKVLDLFAGTGALGIEALSRGAEHCDFVERNATACATIRENLKATDFAEASHVYCLPIRTARNELRNRYTLIMADPPYNDLDAVEDVFSLSETLLHDADSLLVLEHSSRHEPADEWGSLRLVTRRRYGDTAISIYRRTGGDS